tara:strand:- start:128 stop:472 length:345 start_codon:yes stop_codon:yes gene_type:complete
MVKRINKGSDGLYHVKGKTYKVLKGSRAEVWHDTAFKTSGNLEKSELIKNDRGRIVSRSKHVKMKSEKGSRFRRAGWDLAKKGKFGSRRIMRENTKSNTRNRTKTAKKSAKKTV